MDINKAITYSFDDERWLTKLGIGALLALFVWLIVPAFFLTGYGIAITRNVVAGFNDPLPEWDDWGGFFKDGLYLTIAYFVYTLPFILLLCCGFIFIFGSISADASAEAGGLLASFGAVTFLLIFCIFFIFIIALAFISPAIAIQYVRHNSLGACFQFGQVIEITRNNFGDIIIVLAISVGLSIVLSLIGSIPIIGWIFIFAANIYIIAVIFHLYGQIAAKLNI